jgi:ElaB/YqjD/DUF883 family membrane-anchored ribosome-binding protein
MNTRARTTEQLQSAAHETIDRVAQAATGAEQRIRAKAAEATDTAHRTQAQAGEAVGRGVAELKSYVATNPLASAGIAIAAGVILSAILRR